MPDVFIRSVLISPFVFERVYADNIVCQVESNSKSEAIDRFLDITDTLNANNEKQKGLCRTEAYQYLRISRSAFDDKVKKGILPKGYKTPGKGPIWFKKDLDEYLKQYDNKKKTLSTNI